VALKIITVLAYSIESRICSDYRQQMRSLLTSVLVVIAITLTLSVLLIGLVFHGCQRAPA
jgi:hypothetical protein